MLGIGNLAKKVFGSPNDRKVKGTRGLVARINALEDQFRPLTDQQLVEKTREFQNRVAQGESLDDILPEAFANCREGARRALGLRAFDVQLMGGIFLHQGNIAEMKTGEGKTLVATFPAYLNALTGKGVHVVAPLSRRQEWPEVKAFASAVARRMEADEPERFVSTMSKAKRKGRIFVDWLRNERGQTAIAPYSTRSRPGAPVATPVTWDELDSLDGANSFHPADILARLELDDPWRGYADIRQSITAKARKRFSSD